MKHALYFLIGFSIFILVIGSFWLLSHLIGLFLFSTFEIVNPNNHPTTIFGVLVLGTLGLSVFLAYLLWDLGKSVIND